jgi:hypothetical protein
MLVSGGLFVVLVPLNVPGFCSVLSRGWHGGGHDMGAGLPGDLLSTAA